MKKTLKEFLPETIKKCIESLLGTVNGCLRTSGGPLPNQVSVGDALVDSVVSSPASEQGVGQGQQEQEGHPSSQQSHVEGVICNTIQTCKRNIYYRFACNYISELHFLSSRLYRGMYPITKFSKDSYNCL
ncbi:hypothetical protein CDAR_421201 [Caerostris darwini]|uniref:Uncharacterized protein n=1 Tax=Caerostris darwini TaxID=1538125 RepID=A0AAV4WCD9_9ARAC|nr:hypothetical protein CDAR_421201 [Caerostris darwini]